MKTLGSKKRCQVTSLTAVLTTVLALWSVPADALTLGRLSVQSALGESLQAEIDLPDITSDEAESLKVQIAPPAAFEAAGLDYSSIIAAARVEFKRRPNGRAYLKISGDRSVQDPYLDLVLEGTWSAGKIRRDYTLLFDPPKSGVSTNAKTTAPQVRPGSTTAIASSKKPSANATNDRQEEEEEIVDSGTTARSKEDKKTKSRPSTSGATANADHAQGQGVTVRSGDTAGRIAAAHKPDEVSLDQMLVALVNANPHAFIKGNVNRMKAGVVLNIPSNEEVTAIPAAQARKTVIAHSKDFNAYRNALGARVNTVGVVDSSSSTGGKVITKTQDAQSGSTSSDKVVVGSATKGQTSANSTTGTTARPSEDDIAKQKAQQEQSARIDEIKGNIDDLKNIKSSESTPPETTNPSGSNASSSSDGSQSTTTVAQNAAQNTDTSTIPVTPPVTPPPAPDVAPPAPPKPPKVVIPPPPPPELSIWEEYSNEITVGLGALVGFLAIGGGFFWWRRRQENSQETMGADASIFGGESRLKTDSFFGASGGQQVDTMHSMADSAVASSLMYSPSQLDGGDVDPVAEADVYLAYGRDLQAEEILREALKLHPQQVSLYSKLLEIYAKRNDLASFNAMATTVHQLTEGQGGDWDRVRALGLTLDANNPLYGGGAGASASREASGQVSSATAAPASAALNTTAPTANAHMPNVDLELPQKASTPPAATTPAPLQPTTMSGALHANSGGSTFDNSSDDASTIEFDLDSKFSASTFGTASVFPASISPAEDPLDTKLALAEEFIALGNVEGARALIREVIAESSGQMQTKAQQMMNALG